MGMITHMKLYKRFANICKKKKNMDKSISYNDLIIYLILYLI